MRAVGFLPHGAALLFLALGCSAPPRGEAPGKEKPPEAPASRPASRPAPEPSFHGRSLSAWVKQFQEVEDYGARVQAADALAVIGAPAASALAESLQDPELRFLASVSLKKIGPPA
ncbi:MAG TPA: hypothetical protein ENJ97_05995, partial [Planctomycetes bacterium]|nr:hypothetical protein [Planctomycetota bacterium]